MSLLVKTEKVLKSTELSEIFAQIYIVIVFNQSQTLSKYLNSLFCNELLFVDLSFAIFVHALGGRGYRLNYIFYFNDL